MINYVYDHKDEFLLILKCSEGTCYSDFVEQLTLLNCGNIEDYQHVASDSIPEFEVTMKLVHMLTHSFYSGFFEPLLHDMNREEAVFFIRKMYHVFSLGIHGTFAE